MSESKGRNRPWWSDAGRVEDARQESMFPSREPSPLRGTTARYRKARRAHMRRMRDARLTREIEEAKLGLASARAALVAASAARGALRALVSPRQDGSLRTEEVSPQEPGISPKGRGWIAPWDGEK